MTEKVRYNVVFMGIGGEKSAHHGIRTWTSFESKSKFQKWLEESKNRDVILAEGVTDDVAVEMCQQTTDLAYFMSFASEATREDGTIDMGKFQMRVATLAFFRQHKQDPDSPLLSDDNLLLLP